MHKKLTIISIVLWSLVLAAAVCAFAFLSSHFGTFGSYFGPEEGNYTIVKEETIGGSFEDITINWISGNLNLLKSDTDEIRVVQRARSGFPKKRMFYFDSHGTSLEIEDGRNRWLNFGFWSTASDLDVYLPEKEFRSLSIEQVSCDLKGDGIHVKELEVDSVSGRIDLTGSFEKISANSVSGSIDIVSDTMLKEFELDAVSGSTTLTLPENDGFTFTFEKVSGSFSSDVSCSQNGEKYVYKDGRAEFSADVVSGSVRLKRAE